VLEHLLARRTLIYGTSITSRIDSAPAWFKRLLHTRLPQSDGSPLRHTLCCRQRKNISVVLRGSPSFDESSKVVMPRAEPQMAAQVVSQVVMKAPTKEAVAAGTAAIGQRQKRWSCRGAWVEAHPPAQKLEQW